MSDIRPEHPHQEPPPRAPGGRSGGRAAGRAGLSSKARLAGKNLPPGLDDGQNQSRRPGPPGPPGQARAPGRPAGPAPTRLAAGPRTFSRVTVTSSHGRADVSVPDDLAVADLVVQVRRLLNAPVGTRWVLAHPESGDLDPDATLADLGILDGELLYLRQHADGFEPPYVEDAAEEASAAAQGAAWSGDAARRALAVLAAVPLALAGPVLLWRFDAAEAGALLAVVLAAAAVGLLLAAAARDEVLAGALAWALPPAGASFAAAGAAAAGLSGAGVLAVATGAAAAAGALGLLVAGRGQPALRWLVATAGTATVPALAWFAMTAAGLPTDRAAAVVAVALVAIQPFLPRLAVEFAGLGGVADRAASGAAVRRQRAQDAGRRARLLLIALLTGTGLPTVLLIAGLALHGGGPHLALAGLLAGATLLRARRYSQAAQVVPVAASGVTGLLVAAVAATTAADGPPATLVVAAALAISFVLAALSRLGSAGTMRTRARMLLDRVETLVLVACGPVLLAVFGAYDWAANVLR